MKNTSNYWNNIGKSYANEWSLRARKYVSEQELLLLNGAIERYLHKGSNVRTLDIGFGAGRFLSVMEKSSSIDEIDGIDFSQSMLQYCKEKFKNSKKIKKLTIGDISKGLPYEKGQFDLVNAIRVIKYSKNWKDILKEVFRILKRDGVFVFEMPNNHSINSLSNDEVAIYKTSVGELTQTLEQIGFKILKIKGGPLLPGFIYDNVNSSLLVRLVLGAERIFKNILGETFCARFIYVVCQKT